MGGNIGRDARRRPSQKRLAQIDLHDQLDAVRASPAWVLEYKFAPLVPSADGKKLINVRRWAFDLACPTKLISVEVEGGLFVAGGRHGGARSVVRDLEKRNAAATLGWRTIHVTPSMVKSGEALRLVKALLGLEEIQF